MYGIPRFQLIVKTALCRKANCFYVQLQNFWFCFRRQMTNKFFSEKPESFWLFQFNGAFVSFEAKKWNFAKLSDFKAKKQLWSPEFVTLRVFPGDDIGSKQSAKNSETIYLARFLKRWRSEFESPLPC